MSPYRSPLRLTHDQPPPWRWPYTIEVDDRGHLANIRPILAALLAVAWMLLGMSVLSGTPTAVALWLGSYLLVQTLRWFALSFKIVKVTPDHE